MNQSRTIYKRPQAQSDLLDIWRYTSRHWGSDKADQYLDKLQKMLQKAAKNPTAFALRIEFSPPVRMALCQSHLLVFTSDDHSLTLIRVLHQKMDASQQLDSKI